MSTAKAKTSTTDTCNNMNNVKTLVIKRIFHDILVGKNQTTAIGTDVHFVFGIGCGTDLHVSDEYFGSENVLYL